MKQINAYNAPYVIDLERWSRMDIFNQIGNISSEVGRSFNAKRRNDDVDCSQAVIRAIDLFDATISVLITNKSPKSKEVLRAKEVYLTAIFSDKEQAKENQSLERYFMQFAIAARISR